MRPAKPLLPAGNIGITVCTTLEGVIGDALTELKQAWQQLTHDFMDLASKSDIADTTLMERMSQSVQYQDRYTQVMEHVLRTLASYRTLLNASPQPEGGSTLQQSLHQLIQVEKQFHDLITAQKHPAHTTGDSEMF